MLLGGFVLIALLSAALVYGGQLAAMGAAYKAKMLCSEIFVAGRGHGEVLPELLIDDLVSLKYVDSQVDKEAKTVTASVYGFAKVEVHFRGHGGCALYDGGERLTGVRRQPVPVSFPAPELLPVNPAGYPKLAAVVNEAFSEPDPERLRRTRAIVVLHQGKIVAERYAAGVGKDTPLIGWSMAKSVMNALVGILLGQGRLTLDTPIQSRHWREPDDPRHRIAVGHLLGMSSGLGFNENAHDPLADVNRMLLLEKDMAAFAAAMPLEAEPGKRWRYSSGDTMLLAAYLRRLLGEDEYARFPQTALFTPIGMTTALMETDASGTWVGASFMYASARDWARLGLLYLQDGIWAGKRLLPHGWVQYTLEPAPSNTAGNYGAGFWLDILAEYKSGHDLKLPTGTFHAIGHEGQFITVVPSHEVVIVRLGKTRHPGAWEHDVFVNEVLAALSGMDGGLVP